MLDLHPSTIKCNLRANKKKTRPETKSKLDQQLTSTKRWAMFTGQEWGGE